MDTMKQADNSNWSLNPEQFSDLASSLNNFFNQAGVPAPHHPHHSQGKGPVNIYWGVGTSAF